MFNDKEPSSDNEPSSTKYDDLLDDFVLKPKNVKRNGRHSKNSSKPKRSPIQISSIELLGHFEANKEGKIQTMDQLGCVRVYNFPVQLRKHQPQFGLLEFEDFDEKKVADDWEESLEDDTVPIDVTIPNKRLNHDFDLLNGYVSIRDGGNLIGFKKSRDKTAIFQWMTKNFEKICDRDGHRLFDLDFSLDNGVVRRVMKSYFDAEPVEIGVIFYRGTYHLFDFKIEEEVNERSNEHSFAGLRFEDFISRPIDGDERGPSCDESNNYNDSVGCYNVIRFKFGNDKILLRGEVDCAIPGSSAALGKEPNVHDFIEIKTSNPHNITELKAGRWFTQCILMGVKHIVVGIKRELGDRIICDEIRAFTMDDLLTCSDGKWSEQKCYKELEKFFRTVKETVTEEDPQIIHMFTFKRGVFGDVVKKKISENAQLPGISEHFEKIDTIQKQIMQNENAS